MALKATIFKAELQVSDMDRGYYHDHLLTIACHPSETEERMMVRLLAFALHADEALVFGNRLNTDDEPDLWQKDLTGGIQVWIDIGQPDEKRIRKACGRSGQVYVYTYSGHSADVWWKQSAGGIEGLKNLTVINLPGKTGQELAALAKKTMKLQCSIQDGQLWLTGEDKTVQADLKIIKKSA